MSTINKKILRTIGLFVGALALSGCFDDKPAYEPLNFKHSQFSYHGATPRNLGIQFKLQGNDPRTIIAVVTLPQYLDFKNQKIQYRWHIDEGVNVIEGERVGEIAIITTEKKLEIKLKVDNFGHDVKKYVRFEAFSNFGKNRFYTDGIVSSQSDSSFETFVQGLENYKKERNIDDQK